MGCKKNLFVPVFLVLFFFLNSPTNAAEEKKPTKETAKEEVTPANPRNQLFKAVINDFCNQRNTKKDRSFCALVFEPNPQTRTLKDNFGLLRVGIQFAIGNAMKTKNFLRFLSEDKAPAPPLKPVLQECIIAYRDYIKDLQSFIVDLEDDPPMIRYDARMASEAVSRCHNSLTASKTYDQSILGRTKVATQYSKLIQEILQDCLNYILS